MASGGSRRSSGSGCSASWRCCSPGWLPLGSGCLARRWRRRSPRASSARQRWPTAAATNRPDRGLRDAKSASWSRRAHAVAALRAGFAGGAGRFPPLPRDDLRRRAEQASASHRAGCRSPPSSTSSTAGPTRRRRSGGTDCSGIARRQPLPPVLDLLRRLGHPARRAGRRRSRASTRTTGSACRSASARTAASTSAPPRTTATTTRRGSPTGAPTPASASSRTSPKRSALRPHNGWGPETHVLLVSGGSHAGNVDGDPRSNASPRASSVHLVPLEPIAADDQARFAISPPWRKHVWRDPEAEGTD